MEASSTTFFTSLLQSIRHGDTGAFNQAFEFVYQELHRLARTVRQGRAGATLNTTALVHEVYAKLSKSHGLNAENRKHFMRIAARAMRQVLARAAERKLAGKRGGGVISITLNEEIHGNAIDGYQLLALNDALSRLEVLDARQCRIIECRFFAGLTIPETAEVLDISTATVNREWQMARAWLAKELKTRE